MISAPAEQILLDVEQLLTQIHIVGVRVLEPLHRVPQGIHLGTAVGLDLRQGGQLIDQLSSLKDRDLKGLCGKVRIGLALRVALGSKSSSGGALSSTVSSQTVM